MITELLTFLSSGKIVDSAGESLKPARNKFMKHGRIGSISAYSSNSIFYFPIVVSDQLMPDEVSMTTRMVERAYASFVVACVSLIPVHKISSDDANSIVEYLGRFHQNIGTGGNIKHNLQQNVMSYGLNKLTESVDAEDPDIRAAQEFILECWENAKKNNSDFVKLIAETVSVNDLFNEDAIDPKTRGIQKQFLAKRAELDTWGFIGEATDDMFDADDYEDMINHLEDSEAEEDIEYDPDSDDELDDDDFDDSLLEAFSLSKVRQAFNKSNKEDPREAEFKELRHTIKAQIIPFDFKKAYMEWYIACPMEDKDSAEEYAQTITAWSKVYYNKIPKIMMCKFKDIMRHYNLDPRAGTYEDDAYVLAFNPDDVDRNTDVAQIKAYVGGRYFTDIIDNMVRINMDNDPKYKPKDYIMMDNIEAARKFLASRNESSDVFISNEKLSVFTEAALPAATRKKLKDSDFGLPKERKYPLHDARHVKLAAKMFGHCSESQQKELAAAILKAAKKHGVEIKVSKKNPLSKYIPSSMVEAVIKSTTGKKTDVTFSQTITTLETISNNKIMSATSLTTLSAMESKLKRLKNKYTKYLNRYKKQYEKTAKGEKVKLKIRFEKQTISDPKAFMKEYGKYIKLINQKLKLIEKRRAELRKQKGISESIGQVNVITSLSPLDLEAVDYCDRIITKALEAPDSEIFEYEEISSTEEDDIDPSDFDYDDTIATDTQLTEAVKYQYNKDGSTRGKDITLYHDKSMFSENDAKRSNDAVPLFTKATIAMETETGSIINQDLIIGIKGYIHRAPSTDLIDDVYNCIINKRKFLRFVKFITGEERSLADLLFGIKELKTDALSGDNARWKGTFKRRKRWSKMSIPYLMKEYTPNGTIIMTMNEVNFIKEQYGIDIMNMDHVRMIMDTDFLLGFVIVDQSEEIVYVRYDGHDYGFQTYTYAMLDREAVASDRMIREMYRAMSR